MNIRTSDAGLTLDAGGIASFSAAPGHSVTCRDGAVWITQDGDPRDIVLGAGERFEFDRTGRALVHALSAASVALMDRRRERLARPA